MLLLRSAVSSKTGASKRCEPSPRLISRCISERVSELYIVGFPNVQHLSIPMALVNLRHPWLNKKFVYCMCHTDRGQKWHSFSHCWIMGSLWICLPYVLGVWKESRLQCWILWFQWQVCLRKVHCALEVTRWHKSGTCLCKAYTIRARLTIC